MTKAIKEIPAPIDLRVQTLSGALLDTVAKPCQCP
jgi:hypothetical protein